MTATLDVALGLVFVFLVLSLLASAIAEALEHYLRYRADYLQQGIEKLLLAGDTALRERFYQHPLIKSLYTTSWFDGKGRARGPAYIPSRQFVLALLDVASNGGVPNAAPAPPAAVGAPGATPAASASAVAHLMAGINANAQMGGLPQDVAQALRTLVSDAGEDMEKVKANVQAWFDGSMDRVAGWYKRRAQLVLFIIGAAISVVINADTLRILHTLSNDQAVRAAVVAAAEAYARDNPRPGNTTSSGPAQAAEPPPPTQTAAAAPPAGNTSSAIPSNITAPVTPPAQAGASGPPVGTTPARPTDIKRDVDEVVSQLSSLGLPIGWRYHDPSRDPSRDGKVIPAARNAANMSDDNERGKYLVEQRVWPGWSIVEAGGWRDQLWSHLLGWLLTAFAISFGAPFWFDTLNKIMVIRSTVKPREKSQEEGSEDRRR